MPTAVREPNFVEKKKQRLWTLVFFLPYNMGMRQIRIEDRSVWLEKSVGVTSEKVEHRNLDELRGKGYGKLLYCFPIFWKRVWKSRGTNMDDANRNLVHKCLERQGRMVIGLIEWKKSLWFLNVLSEECLVESKHCICTVGLRDPWGQAFIEDLGKLSSGSSCLQITKGAKIWKYQVQESGISSCCAVKGLSSSVGARVTETPAVLEKKRKESL